MSNLAALLSEVSTELARVEKKGKAPSAMGGFAFVREQDVVEAMKPLLDARQIRLRPDVEDIRLDLYPRQGKDAPGVLATVTLALYAVHGGEVDLLARTVGQGADTQDKAPAKAITAAKKQALLIGFSIPTGDDPEATHLDDAPPARARNDERTTASASGGTGSSGDAASGTHGGSEKPATKAQKDMVQARARAAGLSQDELKALREAHTDKASSRDFTSGDIDKMVKAIAEADALKAATGGGTVIE